jgi:hypothetical protein
MTTATVTATGSNRRRVGIRVPSGAKRAAIFVAGLILSAGVLRCGLAMTLGGTEPLLAARFIAGDARVSSNAARTRVQGGERPNSPAVRSLVRAALERDATLAPAIELRALDLQASGDPDGAARLFGLSRAISRRSLATNLWLVQRAVERGDVGRALGGMDLALRTSTAAPNVIFPVLARAAADPSLAVPIAKLLDRPSDWREQFLDYAIANSGSGQALLPLVLQMRDRGFIREKGVDRALIAQLVKAGAFASGNRVQQAYGPPVGPSVLIRDGSFGEPQFTYPFGWGLIESAAAWATRDGTMLHPILSYRGTPGGTGQVATQLLTLEPGTYHLRTLNAAAPADPTALPFWTITCADTPPVQIALIDVATRDDAVAEADFRVRPGCNGQWLALNLRASDLHDGQSGAIRSVNLVRR